MRQRLCRRWAGDYTYPGSIPSAPAEGLSIPDWNGGVKRPAYLARFPPNTRRTVNKRSEVPYLT